MSYTLSYTGAEIDVAIGKGLVAMEQGVDYVTAGNQYGATIGNFATVEGYDNVASAPASHAEGVTTQATAEAAHAEGDETIASASFAHAEGYKSTASGYASHVENGQNTASGSFSSAAGNGTVANHKSQSVLGEWNVADPSSAAATFRGNYALIVGNGTYDADRSNALTLDWSGNETLAGTLTVGADPVNSMDVATKKYVDGLTTSVNEEMTVGTAEQLLSSVYTTDTTPYTYRQTGGGVSVGNRERVKSIVGASIGWNQLAPELTSANYTFGVASISDGVATGTQTEQGFIIGAPKNYENAHKYYAATDIKLTSATSDVYLRANGSNRTATAALTAWQTVTAIFNASSSGTGIGVYDNRGSAWDAVSAKNFQLIDLTLMLGSTVADYVYAQESGTAGAGVALLKQWGIIDGTYKAYDAGSIKSVNVSAHKTVGVNQWDEEWEVGTIDSNGANYPSSTNIRSKNYIPVIGGQTYYVKSPYASGVQIFEYDINKNYVNRIFVNDTTITLSENTVFIRFRSPDGNTTYNHDICINISNAAINGQYFPYEAHTYALNAGGDLRGVLKLDGSNNLYADGDVYTADGDVAVKYSEPFDLGTLTWTKGGTGTGQYPFFYATLATTGIQGATCVCQKYVAAPVSSTDNTDGIIYIDNNGTQLRIRDTAYTSGSPATFKTAMNGVYMVYELATPTTRTADPYQEIQICADGGTEEYTQTFPVPVGHETEYYKDIVKAIEGIPEAPSANGTYTLQVTVTGGVASYSWT